MSAESAITEQVIELPCKVTQRLRSIAPFGWKRTPDAGTCRPGAELGRQLRSTGMIDCQGRAHEAAPDLRWDRPSADLSQRLVVVAPDPHANDKVARKADEQRIAIFRGRACLAESWNSQRGSPSGAVVGRGIKE